MTPAQRPIVHWPDKSLSQPSLSCNGLELAALNTLYREMCHAMYKHNGIGLSAVQVGVPLRMFVVDYMLPGLRFTDQNKRKPIVAGEPLAFIDPAITMRAGSSLAAVEGCLSFPGVQAKVKRWSNISIVAAGLDGEQFELAASDLAARCILHEMDHLEGVTLANYASPAWVERGVRKKLAARDKR